MTLKNFTIFSIAVLLFIGLSLGLALSFNLIEEDRKDLTERTLELEAKYNTIQKELTEALNKQDKVLLLMGVYRDGINTLKEQIDYNSRTLNTFNIMLEDLEAQSEMQKDLLSEQEEQRIETQQVFENNIEMKEEVVLEEEPEQGVVIENSVTPPTPPVPIAKEEEVDMTPVVFTCPKFKKGNLDRYIKRITFRQDTTKVLLTFDVIDGVITNVVVRETNVADRKLFGALERYLRDNAIIESNMSVTNCRLPFRVDLT